MNSLSFFAVTSTIWPDTEEGEMPKAKAMFRTVSRYRLSESPRRALSRSASEKGPRRGGTVGASEIS